jgi:acetyl-CoA carboxylase carboxyltransferase component
MEGQGMSTNSKASQRINALLDDNSFVEIGAGIKARATDFNMKPDETPADGVMTGYGSINDKLVYVYAQDVSVLNGTIGEMHSKKIRNLYDLALKMGAPIIGLLDSAGFRLQEGIDALEAFGNIYQKQVLASGVIPQISAIFGNCGGGLALFPTMTDFTFMEAKDARLYVNAPNALDGNVITKNDTSKSDFQAQSSGIVDVVATDDEIFSKIRELISYLPSNSEDVPDTADTADDLNRQNPEIASYAQDTLQALAVIADDGLFYELKAQYAPEMVIGFLRLNGSTVGAVANRLEALSVKGDKPTKLNDGFLTSDGAEKAADFVNFCDAFEIPVLSLTNIKGYEASIASEKRIAKAAAKLTYAFANASVPKVNVIVGNAYGTAAIVMNSKATGADLAFAWADAKIGSMDAKMAAMIMYEGQGQDTISLKTNEYEKLQNAAQSAAARGFVDAVIEPQDTRQYVVSAFEMLYSKQESRPDKKHGTI